MHSLQIVSHLIIILTIGYLILFQDGQIIGVGVQLIKMNLMVMSKQNNQVMDYQFKDHYIQ